MSGGFVATPNQRKASDPGASAWVGANAGSGKTHVLVDRIIRLMLDSAPPSSILCLTYTKAAATEMATRVHERLSAWVAIDDQALRRDLTQLGVETVGRETLQRARKLFTAAIETPGGFKIQTIHAFCEKLLQLFPVEAGLAPGFTVLDAGQSQRLQTQARDGVLAAAQALPQSDIARAMASIVKNVQASTFDDLLRILLGQRAEIDQLFETYGTAEMIGAGLRKSLGLPPGLSLQESEDSIADFDPGRMLALAKRLHTSSSNDQRTARQLDSLAQATSRPALINQMRDLFFVKKDRTPKKPKSLITDTFRKANPEAEAWLHAHFDRMVEAVTRHDLVVQIEATQSLLLLTKAISDRFLAAKQARGAYDFDDLILRTRDLLANRQAAQWVLYKLDRAVEHVLVDEAQDTSLAQWSIVNALTEEFYAGSGGREGPARTLFVVGDHKQSIFSFQGANPDAFAESRAKFRAQIRAAGQPFHDENLTVSYRSTPEVLQIVDTVFAEGQPARRGLTGQDLSVLHHQSNRKNAPGVFELWPLVQPEDSGEPTPWTAPIDHEPATSPRRILARQIARTIKSWIGRRMIAARNRPAEPGDILILFRSRSTLFDALISELRKQQVPVAGADRMKLAENIAVMDVTALIRFVLQPDDDYSLACVLKSPLVPAALSEDQLMAIAAKRGLQPLWQQLGTSGDAACREAVAALSAWIALAGTTRPFEFISAVIRERRRAILARLGSEAGDALDALLELALSFEQGNTPTLTGFAEWLASEDTEIKRNMEASQGEVRLMTIHGAKGLEASIVIMPDTTTLPRDHDGQSLLSLDNGPTLPPLPLWRLPGLAQSDVLTSGRDSARQDGLEEYRRLLYVAMTRAKDELYVCGALGGKKLPEESWYAMITAALEAGAPHLPALRRVQAEGSDGTLSRLGPDPVMQADTSRKSEAAVTVIPDWALAPVAPVPAGPPVLAISRLGGGGPQQLHAAQRALRGRIIHRLFQELPRLGADAGKAFATRILARHQLPDALYQQVMAIIRAPDFSHYFSPGGQSEVMIGAVLPGGEVLHGAIDRLVMGRHDILLLDYKSDWTIPAGLTPDHPHVVQLAGYAYALMQAYPGRRVSAAILWTERPELMVIAPETLATAVAALTGESMAAIP
jgi:ATP-dependent helicase/nuclease subunit A